LVKNLRGKELEVGNQELGFKRSKKLEVGLVIGKSKDDSSYGFFMIKQRLWCLRVQEKQQV
jgi:hypothetical protein